MKILENISLENLSEIQRLLVEKDRKSIFKLLGFDKKDNFIFTHILESISRARQTNLLQFSKRNEIFTVQLISIQRDETNITSISYKSFIAYDDLEIVGILNQYFKDFIDNSLIQKLRNSKKSNFLGMCE